MTPRAIAGLGEIADGFDAFLLDQFGVLHDGEAAFPGAVEAVWRLREAGARIAVLSNSGKLAGPNAARLEKLGFDRALFDAVVTSGEACRARVQAMLADGRLAEGAPVRVVTRFGDSPIAGLPLIAGPDDAAELVIIAGREPERRSLEEDRARLAPLAARGVACLCANPDEIMYAGGRAAEGPGALAAAYAADGGRVEWLGKPEPALFEAALAALDWPRPARTLMIGDSPAHDIAGARSVGCAALLVTEGVQAGAAAEVVPDFTMPRLRW